MSAQRYEVMFLCHLADARIDDLKQGWGTIGDSIVVVGGDGLWNCHVHTDDVGAAIEAPLALEGGPFRIRVTDLSEEVETSTSGVRPRSLLDRATQRLPSCRRSPPRSWR